MEYLRMRHEWDVTGKDTPTKTTQGGREKGE